MQDELAEFNKVVSTDLEQAVVADAEELEREAETGHLDQLTSQAPARPASPPRRHRRLRPAHTRPLGPQVWLGRRIDQLRDRAATLPQERAAAAETTQAGERGSAGGGGGDDDDDDDDGGLEALNDWRAKGV